MLKLHMQQPVCSAQMHLWLFDEQPQGIWVAKPVELLFEKKADSPNTVIELPPPTFDLSWNYWSQLLRIVPETITGFGVETRAAANGAELKATKYHLEDMRKMALDLALRRRGP